MTVYYKGSLKNYIVFLSVVYFRNLLSRTIHVKTQLLVYYSILL